MKEKVFGFALCALLSALSDCAQAQQTGKIPRIGFLIPGAQSAFSVRTDAMRQGLRELGYVEGKNVRIEYRYNSGVPERLNDLARELARLNPDVIFAVGSEAAQAAHKAAPLTPIVATAADPVGTGLAANLARPAGMITGLSLLAPELSGKRIELLKEVAQKIERVAVLVNPTTRARNST